MSFISSGKHLITAFGIAAILASSLPMRAAAQDGDQCYNLTAEEQPACEATVRVEAVMKRHKRQLYSILHALPGAGPKGTVTTDIDDENRDVIEITVSDEANLAAVQAKAPEEIEGVPVVVTPVATGDNTGESGSFGDGEHIRAAPGVFLGPGVFDFGSTK